MALLVRDVIKLLGPNGPVGLGFVKLSRQALGDMDIVPRVLVGLGRHFVQLRAAEPQRVLLLLGLGLGNHDYGTVAAGLRHQSEADAGVARRAVDDDAAGLEQRRVPRRP